MKTHTISDAIIYEDENLIAINKPSGISTLDDRVALQPSILDLIRNHCETAQLCHRLDKETSGILMAAKNPETYREMAMLFEKRKIVKTYWAITEGRKYFEDFTIEIALGQTSRGRAKIDRHKGKPASTTVNTLEIFKHFSLVACQPYSGRLHQIRIHLASSNAPIAGDLTYGGHEPFLNNIKKNYKLASTKELRPMIARSALHAKSLLFTLYGKEFNLDADLHKDMEVFLQLLRKYDT
ncbi:MAG: RluA family pseudouridine synthase [Bacteroidia bacterium]|jgi:RluA family pseudouridine synthase